MNHQQITVILQQLKNSLKKLYQNQLIDVILFGSYAKNKAHQHSDIDILIILKNEFNLDEELAKTSHLVADLCLEHDILISRLFMSKNYYKNHQSALIRNIHQEGIKI